ncbi:metal-sensing transcriptional repressor [Nitrospirillum sp. BR 11163]|uniref:metal-sensing transcriptional repressor n=1 Tax=Nitrospirillum sp. BR 11163 TaxID=3104323 RepID=UPI002AFE40DC|nr:metal-sensing transcriptional repressor [Nitrospirillum sp. BR 11163]MEA1672010.1 metal-sensing transcriptional repressor [Nitrospirillum sp. BR 11163]
MSHANNPDVLNRLKRAQGHLSKIVEMVEEGRDALVIAQQLQAVVKAVDKAKTFLVLHHIEHHLHEAVGALPKRTRDRLAEMAEITKYL